MNVEAERRRAEIEALEDEIARRQQRVIVACAVFIVTVAVWFLAEAFC